MHKEAGRDVLLPSRLQREHGREDTLMLDFWPPELSANTISLVSSCKNVSWKSLLVCDASEMPALGYFREPTGCWFNTQITANFKPLLGAQE